MAETEISTGSTDLGEARELVRAAAKWFIAGLGGIGAVLVAGSQLSSVGALDADTARFWVAIFGVSVGLIAIMWAMWRVVDVLAPQRWSFEDIVSAWEKPANRSNPVGKYLHAHPLALGGFESPVEIQRIYVESDPDREGLDDLVALMNDLLEKSATISLQARFGALKWQIAAGVLFGAAGIIAFAWAANPADPDDPKQPPPALRGADLRGADLRGASLRNVDLTDADLTDANLAGADVQGAKLKGVVWSNTTCPDGTNSDASARSEKAGKPEPGTCVGHLMAQSR